MNSQHKSPLVLVDGSSYLFRAFFALPPLTNADGQPTGAIYGVVNMIRKLIKDHPDSQIIIVFDPKGKTFRHQLYPDYKANRTVMPDDLQCQIQPLFEIIKAMGLPLIIVDDVEADDVIGTLSTIATEHQRDVIISTSDKDLAQLVNQHVTLFDSMKNRKLGIDGVKQKFGVFPEGIIDYLALMGDSSDNIPGIPKVGPKTALKWLETYGSIEQLIERADEVGGKVGENLREHSKHLPLYQQLVTVKLDVKLPMDLHEMVDQPEDKAALMSWFSKLGFKTWYKKLAEEESSTITSEPVANNYQLVVSQEQLLEWVGLIKKAGVFALDTETTGLDTLTAELVGVSLALDHGKACYIPLGHVDQDNQLDRVWVLNQLQTLLLDRRCCVVGQNLKFDLNMLARQGIMIQSQCFDTMLAAYVVDPSGRHDMATLAQTYLGKSVISFEDVAGKGAKQITFDQVPVDKALVYAAEDADITFQLYQVLKSKLDKHKVLNDLFETMDMPLMTILAAIEQKGVLIDKALLQKQSHKITQQLAAIEANVYQQAGETFNLASPRQLQTILFEKMKLPVIKKTAKGQPSTDESVLQELAKQHDFAEEILTHRHLSKLKSTYTDRLPEQIDQTTGRVHTSYNQAVTSTGRLSSANPNLQNIPIRSEQGRQVRQAFIAQPGYLLIAADYSQIELRLMAHFSEDPTLVEAFANNKDVHSATAAELFGGDIESVNPEHRRRAKAINFGLIYGMSAFGLGKQLDVSRTEAQDYIDRYFQRYPKVKAFMAATRDQATKDGFVTTLFGRQLPVADINSQNKMRQKAAQRAAINAPLQGSAADIIKQAMIKCQAVFDQGQLKGAMIMQVHDELVFEIHKDDVKHAISKLTAAMESAAKLAVPLTVTVGYGNNWGEAH